jgi:diguanylate cyclase (GGDEF)-like protein
MTSTSSERESQRPGTYTERASLLWLYLLAAVPALTDLIETGRLPAQPREWVTEVVAGLVIAVLVHKVRKAYLAVLSLARSDALTGLWNRRAFEEAIEDECVRARRAGQPLSLVYIDLDNFKQINDRAGHDEGDLVLKQLAAAIRHCVRARVDRGFRLGGDEFALLLPGSSAEEAEAVVTRINEHCARADPVWCGGPLGLSAGIVELGSEEGPTEFVRRADDAMYRKKGSRSPSADRA